MNNLGITISFIIGGLLIISILTLNGRVIQNSGETVLNMTAKGTVQNVGEIMRRDMLRLGYNQSDTDEDAIKNATTSSIKFLADVDDEQSSPATTITWEFKKPTNPFTTTGNPDDFELVRTNSGTAETYRFPVTKFELSYADTAGNSTTDEAKISSINIILETQSPEQYGNNGYSQSLWEKTFSPPNLKLQDMDW